MNNPFDYKPDAEALAAFGRLTAQIDELRKSPEASCVNFCRELDDGKMLGALVAEDPVGGRHTLYAFSGQLGHGGFFFPGFVEPVIDYLRPDGHYKTREAEIICMNAEIEAFEAGVLDGARGDYERARKAADEEIEACRRQCREAKRQRDERRASGLADAEEEARMIRTSQFEKAELRRLKTRAASALAPLEAAVEGARKRLAEMKERRRRESEALQQWLFSQAVLLNARGEERSVRDIFAETALKVPPSGAGECCAPKLLQAAYRRGWRPVSMAEFWYGRPKGGEVRIHGAHYPACRGKCLPLLQWMLQGLVVEPPLGREGRGGDVPEPVVVFRNPWFCVVEKPAGMLSVQGRTGEISVERWLAGKFGADSRVKVAHRLDQATSGLLIATFGPVAFKEMQALFARRMVRKTYVAVLDGDYRDRGIAPSGRIELPLAPDLLDRPRQRVDVAEGKEAVTDYEFVEVRGARSRIVFYPRTGRTHQLRVHAASSQGLGMPIAGDRLYGTAAGSGEERLHLHASRVEFTFPVDGEHYAFESPVPF